MDLLFDVKQEDYQYLDNNEILKYINNLLFKNEKEEKMAEYKMTKEDTKVGVTLYNNKLTVYGYLQSQLIDKGGNPFSTDLLDSSITASEIFVVDNKNTIRALSAEEVSKLNEDLKKINTSTYTDNIAAQINGSKSIFTTAMKEHSIIDYIDKETMSTTSVKIQPLFSEMKEYNKMLADYLTELKKGISGNIEEYLDTYFFKEHLMLLGERGASKTYTVTKYLADKGIETEFMGCHNAVEAIDLLGYYIKAHDGSFVWLDGALSGAFRKAQAGTKVVLFMDEILRMPAKELNILVAALTPDAEGYFNLRTNRITDIKDGIGEVELLRVPKDMLWVIATTNIGADYDVEEIDVAFQDRFMSVEVELNEDVIRNILYKYTEDDIIVDKLINAYNKVNMAVEAQELANKLNVRHLVKVITYAGSDIKKIKDLLLHFAPNICSRNIDGKLNKMDIEVYKEIIKSL